MRIYLAHPMKVNPKEILTSLHDSLAPSTLVQILGSILNPTKPVDGTNGAEILLPEDFGPDVEDGVNPEVRKYLARSIAEGNKGLINASDLVIALIDDRDPGVMWELGYANAKGIPAITFSIAGHGSNIMIEQTVLAHFTDPATLVRNVRKIVAAYNGGVIP